MNNRKSRRRPRSDSQTVYTQPKAFNPRRLAIQIATVVAVVFALAFGMSIFFKVETVKVAGVDKYIEYQVKEASGIEDGDNIFGLSKSSISSRIMQKLPYVGSVRVGISLPGTVNIQVEELTVTYAIADQDGARWLMASSGKIVEKISGGDATAYTNILGVTLDSPALAQQAVAHEPGPAQDENGETVPVTTYASERLDMALTILQQLEVQGILGEAASVDVSDMDGLVIWYGDQFEISLGDGTQLEYKLALVKGAIAQIGEYRTGSMDVSFEIRPNEVIFTPFE